MFAHVCTQACMCVFNSTHSQEKPANLHGFLAYSSLLEEEQSKNTKHEKKTGETGQGGRVGVRLVAMEIRGVQCHFRLV